MVCQISWPISLSCFPHKNTQIPQLPTKQTPINRKSSPSLGVQEIGILGFIVNEKNWANFPEFSTFNDYGVDGISDFVDSGHYRKYQENTQCGAFDDCRWIIISSFI